MRVNLIPQPKNLYSISWTNILIYSMVIVIIFAMGIHYFVMRTNFIQIKERLNGIENQLSILSEKKRRYDKLEAEIRQLEALQAKSNENTYDWPIMVKEQGFIVPEKLVYQNMRISDKKLYLNGTALNNSKIINLIDSLNKSPYFENVRLMRINQGNDGIGFTLEVDIIAGGEQGV